MKQLLLILLCILGCTSTPLKTHSNDDDIARKADSLELIKISKSYPDIIQTEELFNKEYSYQQDTAPHFYLLESASVLDIYNKEGEYYIKLLEDMGDQNYIFDLVIPSHIHIDSLSKAGYYINRLIAKASYKTSPDISLLSSGSSSSESISVSIQPSDKRIFMYIGSLIEYKN